MSTNRDNAPLLVLRGVNVQEDEYGNVCLNDLWTLAGGPENRRPVDWHRGKRASALQAALDDRMVENLHYSGANPPQTYRAIGKGRGSRTFAHPVLALDYAEYLQPALGVEVREIFLRYRAADISLANDILDGLSSRFAKMRCACISAKRSLCRTGIWQVKARRQAARDESTRSCTMPGIAGSTMDLMRAAFIA
jgi:hypothetical protein